jgi:flagellar basal-body rod protein FlgB
MWNELFGSEDLIGKGLQASQLRQEVISNNIANTDTVNFKTSQVEFEDLFKQALTGSGGLQMTATNARHITTGSANVEGVTPQVVQEDTTLRYDGNNVDTEHEMAEMAKNTIEYYTLVSKVNSDFRKLKAAIDVT